jgi:Fur family transcriptional regulator, ferric uptake regulator
MPTRQLREEAERFYAYLRKNKKKKTYQKDLILETFLNTEGHLSVEDIYALVKKRDKKVGVVTVFRTLKSLKECGIAQEINLEDGLTRFEHSYHHPMHHHIVCKECHRAIEFVCPELERIQEEIIQKYHFQRIHHRFQTYGICEDCREHRSVLDAQKHDTERIFARDAIKMALCMEAMCLEFYRDSANRNQDPGGKEVFEKMMQEEEKHIASLNGELEAIIKQEKDLQHVPAFLHFDPHELKALILNIPKPEMDVAFCLDAQASMDLTLVLNTKTTDFFKSFADRFAETQGKKIFLNFADQEGKHGDLVRQRIKSLQNSSSIT